MPPKHSKKSVPWRLVIALVVIALGGLLWRPTAPKSQPDLLPAAAALGPGVGFTTRYAGGSEQMSCSAGFLVRTSSGQSGFLTAGHCDQPGGAGKPVMKYSRSKSLEPIGTFTKTVHDDAGGEHDIALVLLDDAPAMPLTPAIAGTRTVKGVASHLANGQQLCKFGMASGNNECGPIANISSSRVAFAAQTAQGDSGGPVYTINTDGSAEAVGIHIGRLDVDYTKFGRTSSAQYSVAELIQPWLDEWELTLVTTPTAAP